MKQIFFLDRFIILLIYGKLFSLYLYQIIYFKTIRLEFIIIRKNIQLVTFYYLLLLGFQCCNNACIFI